VVGWSFLIPHHALYGAADHHGEQLAADPVGDRSDPESDHNLIVVILEVARVRRTAMG
jgi:hypothetical protein